MLPDIGPGFRKPRSDEKQEIGPGVRLGRCGQQGRHADHRVAQADQRRARCMVDRGADAPGERDGRFRAGRIRPHAGDHRHAALAQDARGLPDRHAARDGAAADPPHPPSSQVSYLM